MAYASATYTSQERTYVPKTGVLLERKMPFHGIEHSNASVYYRSVSETFQINVSEFFHLVHIDGVTHPTNLKFYLPYKAALIHKSVFWVFYVKESTAGDTITFECVDAAAGINSTDGPGAAYSFTSEGNPLVFLVLCPGGDLANQNRYYIHQIHPGIPHISLTGTGICTVIDAYPNFTINVPDTIVVAGTRCTVTELPDHTYTIDTDPSVVVAGTGRIAVVEAPVGTYTVSDDPTIVAAGTGRIAVVEAPAGTYTVSDDPTIVAAGTGRIAVVEAPAGTYTVSDSPTIVLPGTNVTSCVEAPAGTYTVNCPTVTITSGGGCTVTGSFPNFTITVP